MNSSIMKKLFGVLVACLVISQAQAQFNFGYKNHDVPVVGIQYGIVGGGHSAGLYNRDDMESPFVDPQIMNFTYFAGVERIQWYTPFFGLGQQALLWNAGAYYKGKLDTTENPTTIDGHTYLTYAKVPLLFWFKSYNRYNPERRLRVNTFFGPYVALLVGGSEEWKFNLPTDPVTVLSYTLNSSSYTGQDQNGVAIPNLGVAGSEDLNKTMDWGFVMGAGVEMRLWRKTVIALTLRTDLGMADVENKAFRVTDATNTEYNFYQDITAKYIPLGSSVGPNFEQNRATTRNFGFGAQLSLRKYFGAE